jgi:predicted ArsR family transcriptional regulator
MRQKRSRPQLAISPEQLKVISFGPRRDIVALLANDAGLSARDLADRLRRPVTSLYRHLDLLVQSGLIGQTGSRAGTKRPEALYALTFSIFTKDEASRSPEGRAALSQAAARYASATARKFARAVENGTARMEGELANTMFRFTDLQLDAEGLTEFHRRLNDFMQSVRELRVRRPESLETISMTILIAPNR